MHTAILQPLATVRRNDWNLALHSEMVPITFSKHLPALRLFCANCYTPVEFECFIFLNTWLIAWTNTFRLYTVLHTRAPISLWHHRRLVSVICTTIFRWMNGLAFPKCLSCFMYHARHKTIFYVLFALLPPPPELCIAMIETILSAWWLLLMNTCTRNRLIK